MATFTAGTSFTDGVTGDVTAAKLNALVANATPLHNLITDRTAETSVASDDLVLISDTSDSAALNKMTVANLMKAELTGTINSTAGTIATLNSTTGTIPTLAATTLLTTGTGTAASPAITPSSDPNTGIFFPAADTIAFSEGGTEIMRIDSSGNVGIGTTSPNDKLDVSGNARIGQGQVSSSTTQGMLGIYSGITAGSGNSQLRFFGKSVDNTGLTYELARIVGGSFSTNSNYSIDGGLAFSTAQNNGSNVLTLTERLRIDSSGNVGIGTTSPYAKVDVVGSLKVGAGAYPAPSNNLHVQAGNYGDSTSEGSINLVGGVGDNGYSCGFTVRSQKTGSGGFGNPILTFSELVFNGTDFTKGTERLRITSGGEVYIAGTTDQGAYNLQVNGTGVWGAGAYVNGSDERLKENIQDITSGLDVVEKLRPVSFQYKEDYTADRSVQSGFIAQDLLVALEGKNYLEGVVSQGPTYYNVAYQNLIPILAKAIQELKSENDSLKSRIEALEAA